MKIGVNSDLGNREPEIWGRQLKALGCGSAVFPVKYTEKEETIEAYVRAAADNGLVIAEVGAWCNPICPDPKVREAALEKCKGQLALADRIGARCCVNIAGAAGAAWDGAYRENYTRKTWELTVDTIREIIDAVRPVRTFYTVEAMPWMYPTGPDQYLELLQAVDTEHFAVHMDICNWISSPRRFLCQEEFMEECFEKLGPWVKSCHLKDVAMLEGYPCVLRETACGEGGICLEKYVSLAESWDEDVPMLIEHLGTREEYEESLAYVRHRIQGREERKGGCSDE